FGYATVTAIDAETGALVDHPRVRYMAGSVEQGWSSFCGGDEAPEGGQRFTVLAGRHVAKVTAEGFRESAELEYVVDPGATVDLGTVRLEPLPRFKLKLVDRGGATPAGTYSIAARFGDESSRFLGPSRSAIAIEPGRFELRFDLPDRFTISILQTADDAGSAMRDAWSQRVDVERWSVDETRELVVAKWHAVTLVVDLTAVPEDLRGASFGVDLRFANDAGRELATDSWRSNSNELRDSPPNERRYRFLLPTGRYVVRGASGLFAIPETPLELTDEQDAATVTIAAR